MPLPTLPTDGSQGFPERAQATATIANGASLSGAVDLVDYRPIAVQMPATWTAANLTFQASVDGTTYQDVYDDSATELAVGAASARYVALGSAAQLALSGAQYLKVRSGASGSPVNQGGARSVVLVLVPA